MEDARSSGSRERRSERCWVEVKGLSTSVTGGRVWVVVVADIMESSCACKRASRVRSLRSRRKVRSVEVFEDPLDSSSRDTSLGESERGLVRIG